MRDRGLGGGRDVRGYGEGHIIDLEDDDGTPGQAQGFVAMGVDGYDETRIPLLGRDGVQHTLDTDSVGRELLDELKKLVFLLGVALDIETDQIEV